MYFLSVYRGPALEELIECRRQFRDFAEAVAACGEYYEPRAQGAVLEFTAAVTGKVLRRANAQLMRPEDVPHDAPDARRWSAAKQSNAFRYGHSYHFTVETEAGIEQAEQWRREDEKDGNV